ncbi:hypothetical protein H2509_16660 [Stappia sp. F7233]|uniref:Uncharacterized protein n=1 Tax=Stappia albiluteola TaxID=2758565 RepID=A0A839AIA7_9HYPH|nr:hypothetical protein [Stappia albiluteola]MBA5778758.1 hypothetical protein [Stappia albiluteola]
MPVSIKRFATLPLGAAVLLGGLALGSAAAFAEPVAMVLDVSEGSEIAPFTELSDGEVLELGTEIRVELLDYRKCREIAVIGGKVSATPEGLEVTEGEMSELRPGKCIQKADAGSLPAAGGAGLANSPGQAAINDAAGPATAPAQAAPGGNPQPVETADAGASSPQSKAASVLLRFDGAMRERYDNVFVSIDGGAPQRFAIDDPILTEMPLDGEGEVELRLEGADGSAETPAETRKFTLDDPEDGRATSVILVK